MLDEAGYAASSARARIEDDPALTLPQAMFHRVEVEAHALEQVSVLDRGLINEAFAIGHLSTPVVTACLPGCAGARVADWIPQILQAD